jgi:predicted amidohydrolase
MSSIRQASPLDLTGLFCELYDTLPEEPFLSGEVRTALADADRRARVIARAILDESFSVAKTARRLSKNGLPWTQQLDLVLGLDRAFADVHPFLAGFRALPPALSELRDRYLESGRLAAPGVPGEILPRLGAPGAARLRLEGPADVLRFVVRVPPAALSDVELLCASNVAADGYSISRRELRVACAPMAESYDELIIASTGTKQAPAYRVGPDAGKLGQRVVTLLRRLDESGATIGVLPEATLDDEVLAAWQDALSRTSAPSDSRLRWIVCGTGPVGKSGGPSPVNRAVVLDRDDPRDPVWVQDKRFRYTMEPPQLSEWHLDSRLGGRRTTEDIHLGKHTVIVESGFGRVAITVCEDLARLTRLKPHLEACGVSLVIAPVFSKEIRPHFWEDQAGKFYVGDGATVVVCNSRAVVTARGLKREQDHEGQDLWGTSLARSPECVQLGHSARPDDVVVLGFPFRIPTEPD